MPDDNPYTDMRNQQGDPHTPTPWYDTVLDGKHHIQSAVINVDNYVAQVDTAEDVEWIMTTAHFCRGYSLDELRAMGSLAEALQRESAPSSEKPLALHVRRKYVLKFTQYVRNPYLLDTVPDGVLRGAVAYLEELPPEKVDVEALSYTEGWALRYGHTSLQGPFEDIYMDQLDEFEWALFKQIPLEEILQFITEHKHRNGDSASLDAEYFLRNWAAKLNATGLVRWGRE